MSAHHHQLVPAQRKFKVVGRRALRENAISMLANHEEECPRSLVCMIQENGTRGNRLQWPLENSPEACSSNQSVCTGCGGGQYRCRWPVSSNKVVNNRSRWWWLSSMESTDSWCDMDRGDGHRSPLTAVQHCSTPDRYGNGPEGK